MDSLTAPRTIATSDEEVVASGGRATASIWPAIVAWGAGLVQIALGAGAITTVQDDPAIGVVGISLIVIGAGALGWGAVILTRGRIVAPRASIAGSLAGILVTATALALDPVRISVFAVAVAIVLLIAVALGCARATRRSDAGRSGLIGLVVAAVLVSGAVTPALAATEAGRHAVPHGEMVEHSHH